VRSRGFTLIELMIVLVVVGILVAVVTPSWQGFSRSLAQNQARSQVLEAIRTARQTAVTTHRPVYMQFGSPPSTTDITTFKTHLDTNSDGLVSSGERVKTYTLPKNTRLSVVALTPTDTIPFIASGTLRTNSTGGSLIVTNGRKSDTLMVSSIGMIFRP
jgi:prepilin-type N-terminal cleavage/methylation domain-containing protein